MRYWDASALVPVIVAEEGTALARSWLEEDAAVVTWALTAVELTSAIERRARQRLLGIDGRRRALELVRQLAEGWDEVTDLLAVRRQALTYLARHNLRAADALQLAAAFLTSEGDPPSLGFTCLGSKKPQVDPDDVNSQLAESEADDDEVPF